MRREKEKEGKIFFFKQKTAYEIYQCDWSSDVCSSDLAGEKEGLCKRITAEVDWNLELSHIAKLNEEQSGPALLFENVKDYDTPVITSVCTTTQRLALIMGQPLDSTLVDLYKAWAKLGENLTPPKWMDAVDAPCKQNILTGDDIDLYKFPVPQWYPLDGGRYIGTAHFIISKDPETGWVNLGTYRGQLLGKKQEPDLGQVDPHRAKQKHPEDRQHHSGHRR